MSEPRHCGLVRWGLGRRGWSEMLVGSVSMAAQESRAGGFDAGGWYRLGGVRRRRCNQGCRAWPTQAIDARAFSRSCRTLLEEKVVATPVVMRFAPFLDLGAVILSVEGDAACVQADQQAGRDGHLMGGAGEIARTASGVAKSYLACTHYRRRRGAGRAVRAERPARPDRSPKKPVPESASGCRLLPLLNVGRRPQPSASRPSATTSPPAPANG